MTLYDKLVISKSVNGSFENSPEDGSEVAMEDMIRYIEKMGGEVTETPNLWEIQCPYLWTGKIYHRFKSFGVRPMIPSETKWLAHTLEPDQKPVTTIASTITSYSC